MHDKIWKIYFKLQKKIKLKLKEIILEIQEMGFRSSSQTQSKYTGDYVTFSSQEDYQSLKNIDWLAENLLLLANHNGEKIWINKRLNRWNNMSINHYSKGKSRRRVWWRTWWCLSINDSVSRGISDRIRQSSSVVSDSIVTLT